VAGDAHQARGQYDEAREAYQRALELHRGAGCRAAEAVDLRFLGAVHGNSGDHQQAAVLFQQSFDLATAIRSEPNQYQALWQLALALAMLDQYTEAVEAGRRAHELARGSGIRGLGVWPLIRLAEELNDRGQYRQALEFGQQAADLAREADHGAGESDALGAAAMAALSLRKNAQALELGRRALALAQDEEDQVLVAHRLAVVAEAHRRGREHALAVEVGEQAMALARETELRSTLAYASRTVAAAQLSGGQAVLAAQAAQQAVDLSSEAEHRRGEVFSLLILAEASLAMGEQDHAMEAGRQMADILRGMDDPSYETGILNKLGVALARAGRLNQGWDYFSEAHRVAAASQDEEDLAIAAENLFTVHLELARERAFEDSRAGVRAGVDAAGVLAGGLDPALVTRRLHDRLLMPLLVQGELDTAWTVIQAVAGWLQEEGFLAAYQGAVDHLLSPDDSPIDSLPQVERGLAMEIVRQAEGRETVAQASELARKGEVDQALETFDRLLDDSPFDLTALREGFRVALAAKQTEAAGRYAQQAVEASGGAAQDLGNRGVASWATDKTEAAQEDLDAAMAAGTNELRHFLALAAIHDGAGRLAQAAKTLKAALNRGLASVDMEARVKIKLVELQLLQDQRDQATETLATIQPDGLPPHDRTDLGFHRYLAASLERDEAAAAVELEAFCDLLVEHPGDYQSTYVFARLVQYAEANLGTQAAVVLRRWAEVARDASPGVFVQSYGSEQALQRWAATSKDEGGLALKRLLSGKVNSLEELRSRTTRADSVDPALDAMAAGYEELPAKARATARDLVLEALESDRPVEVQAALNAVGRMFWQLSPEQRQRALADLADVAGGAEASLDLRDAALRVVGALYFQLKPEEKAAVVPALRAIAEDYAPSHLRDLLARIKPGEEGEPG